MTNEYNSLVLVKSFLKFYLLFYLFIRFVVSSLLGSAKPQNHQRSNSQTRSILANPSMASFISTGDERCSLKETTSGEKKLSIGKRLLQSARSSLKSQSSKNKTLASNSAASISNKNLFHIADIDFRKSRASLIDDNLLIDGGSNVPTYYRQINSKNDRLRSLTPNIYHGTHVSLLPGQILVSKANTKDANFILRSRSPGGHHRLRSLTPGSAKLERNENNYMPSNYHRSSLSSLSANQISTRGNEITVNHFPNKHTRTYAYETDEYETDVGDGNEYSRVKNFYKSEKAKVPINNPKMFANHLIWNQASRSAECLDCNYDTIKSTLTSPSKQTLNPIAKAVSPGKLQSLVINL